MTATDLACRRGDRVLFRGLNLSLNAGDALHITGANGIGKSSLLRIMAGLLRPLAGSVECSGAIGLLDERPALDLQRPLGRALAFWARIDGAPRNERQSMSSLLGLGPLQDVPVRYLSTGQRKRAALVRLIDQNAPIWLLDEPLNGLDSEATAIVERIVADHCSAGGIAVIASHQPFTTPCIRPFALADHVPSLDDDAGDEWP
ncbi:MAG: heme ABC exporter ATP-binding protein CcmA [Caenibius sp.]